MGYKFNPFTGKLDNTGTPSQWDDITGGIQYDSGKVVVGGCDTATEKLAIEDTLAVYTGEETYDDATGGTITHYTDGDTTYTVHTFSSDGTFVNNKIRDVDYLVVAGGGAGGTWVGAGGGAGGVLTGTLSSLSSGNKTVTVGEGGAQPIANGPGDSGDNSVFDSITATGGGGGGSYPTLSGLDGGSGGGAAYNDTHVGEGTDGQGYNGGYNNITFAYSGGGGGAGEAGATDNSSEGGDGVSSSITGTPTYYGGGGGGFKNVGNANIANGGQGGGGKGGSSQDAGGNLDGEPGTDGLGGGGGGGHYANYGMYGGKGGKGVVIVRYVSEYTTAYVKKFDVNADGDIANDGDITAGGDITGNNLSGENTGDQDLSGYALSADVFKLDQSTPQTVTGTPTFPLLKTPKIYPSANSATAVQVTKADGSTVVLNVDTNDSRLGIQNNNPAFALDVGVTNRFIAYPDFAGLGEVGANSVVSASSAGDYTFFADTSLTTGKKVMMAYANGSTPTSAMEIANVASGYGNLLLMKSGGKVGVGTNAPTSGLHSNASFARKTEALSSTTTLDATHYRVLCSGASTTINLPTASGITGREYNIIRTGTSNITITPNGAETISGDANLILTSQWDSVVIVSDGTNWVRCS